MSNQSVFGTHREVVDHRDPKSGHFSAFLSPKILEKGKANERLHLQSQYRAFLVTYIL